MSELVQYLVAIVAGVLLVVFRAKVASQIVGGQNYNFRARMGEREEREIRRIVVIVGVGTIGLAFALAVRGVIALRAQ